MFAVSGDPDSGVLNFRNLTHPDIALEVTIDPYISMHTDHRVLIALNYQTDAHAVVRSTQDVTRVRKVRPRPGPRWHYDSTCLIDERLFAAGKDRDTIVLQDITMSTYAINLCDTTDKYIGLLCSARWQSHTWISTNMEHRGAQHPDSRELCTIVDMNIQSSSAENAQIATGNCLYGHVVDSTRRHFITALDPRETTSAREVYSDGAKWSWCVFRDVPNGVAVAVFDELGGNTCIVNIFDERSCAMIGTDIFLGRNEYLFCLPQSHNTIEMRFHNTYKCTEFSTTATPYKCANCAAATSYAVIRPRM